MIKKIDKIRKPNEEYISVTNGCFRFTENFRFLLNSVLWLVKTPVNNNHEIHKNSKEESARDDNILNNFNEIETLIIKDKYIMILLEIEKKIHQMTLKN